MGQSIEAFISKLESLKIELPKEAARLITGELKEQIIDLNTGNQLFDLGIDSDGKFLGFYRPYTIFTKKIKLLPYNRITLFDTGAFYRGWDIRVVNNTIQFFSRDSKSSMLQEDYGSAIFGLTNQNAEYMNNVLLNPKLNEFTQKHMQ
jgi:hypothetical protein